jgi:hypothetical protein
MGLRIAVVVAAGGAHSLLAKLLYSRAPALPSGGGHSTAEMELATRRCTTAGTWLTRCSSWLCWRCGAGTPDASPGGPTRRHGPVDDRPASVLPEQLPLGLLGKEGPGDRTARMPSEDARLERNGRPVAGRHSGGHALPQRRHAGGGAGGLALVAYGGLVRRDVRWVRGELVQAEGRGDLGQRGSFGWSGRGRRVRSRSSAGGRSARTQPVVDHERGHREQAHAERGPAGPITPVHRSRLRRRGWRGQRRWPNAGLSSCAKTRAGCSSSSVWP